MCFSSDLAAFLRVTGDVAALGSLLAVESEQIQPWEPVQLTWDSQRHQDLLACTGKQERHVGCANGTAHEL